MQPADDAGWSAGLDPLSTSSAEQLRPQAETGEHVCWLDRVRQTLPQAPAMLRPSFETLQVLQKARQKLQKVAKEDMAAAIVQQDHAGVLRFSALFSPLGYQVCRLSLTASNAWALHFLRVYK